MMTFWIMTDFAEEKPSLQVQYEEKGKELQVSHEKEFGECIALCVGDIAIFRAFSYLSQLTLPEPIYKKVFQMITKEFLLWGSVNFTTSPLGIFHRNHLLRKYLICIEGKTARYTFSLPMNAWLHPKNQSVELTTKFEKLGENIGLMFQLQDDLLTINGNNRKRR